MAATPVSEISDGPVLSVINKRLRALRKKYNRILQMEESLANGKILNKEQEETFRSKPSVIAAIDELEKLRQPLAAAVTEEINLSNQHHNVSAADSTDRSGGESNKNEGLSVVEDLLNLIYFGNMFDHAKWGQSEFISTMLKRAMHERACCLNYDCMPEDESTDVIDLLSEKDLDLISMLSELLVCRSVNSTLSHKHALQRCIEHAKLWVTKSDQPIGTESTATYAGLRSKLNRIMSSLYFTTDPVFRVEEAAEDTEGVITVDATVKVDSPAVQYQEEEEEYVSSQADESNEIHGSSVEELHQEENVSEQPVAEQEEVILEGEGGELLKDASSNDQQSVHRRSYHQNNRGSRGGNWGSRRGNFNGRGGRGRGWFHHNDSNPQYDRYDYYQKSYYNYRGRGGRGSRGGGNDSHYASGNQAGNISTVS